MNRKNFIKKCMGVGYSKKRAEELSKTVDRWGSYDAAWLFDVAGKRVSGMSVADRVKLCGQADRALKRGSVTESDVNRYMDYASPIYFPGMEWTLPAWSHMQMEKIGAERVVSYYDLRYAASDGMRSWMMEREKEELFRSLMQYAKKYVSIEKCEASDGVHYRATLWVGQNREMMNE